MLLTTKRILREMLGYINYINTPLAVTYDKTIFQATATARTLIQEHRHTSNTGKIHITASFPLYTSRFTSSVTLEVNGVAIQNLGTNVQPNPNTNCCDRVNFNITVDVPKNDESVIRWYLASQDSGTTATVPPYRQGIIAIRDVR